MASAQSELLIGVDVGTESVRVGLFNTTGKLLSVAKREIRTWHGDGGVVEQSTDQIWHGVVEGVREVSSAEIRVGRVIGIGFCATCSLAVVAAQGKPLRVRKCDESEEAEENGICWERNVIVWMDQRAATQAERINSLGHSVLRFTGGRISPEMQAAKLLWLKENVPDSFYRAAHFFDLADFCTWRATESDERSICTLTCKWTFLGHEKRWDEGFFRAIGLNEIVDQNFQKIGQRVLPLGAKVGSGLSTKAAKEFGLSTGTSVGVGLIDAHAGALGTMSGEQQQMALILGTSLCTMNLSREPIFVHGIWGPYFGVVFPNLWLNEGGMTSFGSALLFALQFHPFYHKMKQQNIGCSDSELLKCLEQIAIKRAGSLKACSTFYGQSLHIVPEFLGNRSPNANPMAVGMFAGLRMDSAIWKDEKGLAEWTIVVLCALCYGLKEIIEQIELRIGHTFAELAVSGGMARNGPLLRLIADISQKCVFVPHCEDTIEEASAQMVTSQRNFGNKIEPQRTQKVLAFHKSKFEAYKALKKCGQTIKELETENA
ncbi:hypothetical protein niasHT_030157 [Heterodera trifolii]|uniref:FGGY carbohydrate kinase domain-containing protein n=1 Tax=Heterodera trifolii TaxID=157864 RepID=A0ABD2K2P4_9BILA